MSGAPCWSVRASRWSAATAGSTSARTREAKTLSGSRDGRADRVLAEAHALADRPLLHVHAFDGHVLADRARLDVDRPQVVRRGEQHLPSGRVRVRAALEALTGDRPPPLVPD